MPVTDPVPASTSAMSARNVASLCDLARLAYCGHCSAGPHRPCIDVGGDRLSGVHLARFAGAARSGLIRGPEFSMVLALAGDTFTSGTVIGGDDPQIAPDAIGAPAHQQMPAHRKEAVR
ncbi:MAG TPA: hypothetical protein VFB06_12980 [Streptosporangiaceae bacterium]|nr:hypothetical protein [Streptosporangiaceae bacterium]